MKKLLVLAVVALTSLAIAGCGGSSSTPASAPKPAPEKVTDSGTVDTPATDAKATDDAAATPENK